MAGSPVVAGPQAAGPARMGPQRLLLYAALFLAQAVLQEASQYCSHLEYWNPDNLCCGSCLQRFGPPPCPGYEFSENCGLNDFGDHVTHPFKECPRGQCNPDSTELCSFCEGRARAPTPAGARPHCGEVLVGLRSAWARVQPAGGGAGHGGCVLGSGGRSLGQRRLCSPPEEDRDGDKVSGSDQLGLKWCGGWIRRGCGPIESL